MVTRYAIAKRAPVIGGGWGWNGEGSSTRGDVSSFRLPAMGLDVFIRLFVRAGFASFCRQD
jgi:hypothetical protein